jgi:two-component system, chemotaxis family, chemotaxis protein CheY
MMKNVLIVDDSPVARNFHINILKKAGFIAEGAGDGVEALEKSLKNKYDLIVCDINMPAMDGLTFIERYRTQTNEPTPIIILTTQETEVNRSKGYESGASLFLVKPIKPQSLILHIKLLLGE